MPLLLPSLASSLTELTRNIPQNALEAGNRWAAAYASYAQGAISLGGGAPVPLAANERVLGGALGAMFANPYNPPPASAQIYASAFTAFWFGPPVTFPLTPLGTPLPPPVLPGIVTLVGGTAALAPALLSAWAINLSTRATNEQAMQRLATVLDSFTRSVIVTHLISVPGPPIVGPLS